MDSLNLKKDSINLINFLENLQIDTNCDFLLITPFIQKYKNYIENNYKKLLPNKISITEPIKRNFKKLIENRISKKSKKSKKFKISEKSKKSKKSKRIDKLAVYLNNIDDCESITGKEKYRSNYIKILDILYKKYPYILKSIYQSNNFTENKIKETNDFLKKIYLTSNDDITDYLNFYGIELVRGVYSFLTRESIPDDIKDIVNLKSELYGEFTSFDIRNEIELKIPYTYIYKYKLGKINLNLEIHSRNKNFEPNKNLLYRIFFVNYILYLNKDIRDINLTLYLSSKKKHLPKVNKSSIKVIGAKEINSGCTTFTGTLPNKVSIWRKEELGKVLIHEIVHSLELEIHNNELLKEFIYNNFDIKRSNKIRLFEGYVETNANLINIILTILESKNIKSKHKKLPNKLFLKLLNIEIKYSLFQVSKILKYFGYNNFNDFYIPGIKEIDKSDKYNQLTNVFSYIIFRSMIFYNLEKFMELLFSKNEPNNLLKELIDDQEKIDFIKDTLQNTNYIETINKLLSKTKYEKQNYNNFVKKTMRLSVLEPKLFKKI